MTDHPPTSPADAGTTIKRTANTAAAAVVCGVLGFFIPLMGLLGIVFGIIVMYRDRREPRVYAGFRLALAGVAIGTLATMAQCAGLFYVRAMFRNAEAGDRMRWMGMAMMSYATENKEWLPEPGSNWQSRVGGYINDPNAFVSPRNAQAAAAIDAYIYLPGYRLRDIKNPWSTVLVYENPKYVPSEKVFVLFADAHSMLVDPADLPALLKASDPPTLSNTTKTDGP